MPMTSGEPMTSRTGTGSPDVIGIEEMEHLTTLQAVAAKVNADAATAGQTGINYEAYLFEGNDPGGIDSGFLVNVANIEVLSVTQVGLATTYVVPDTGATASSNSLSAGGAARQLTHSGISGLPRHRDSANHMRSLSGADGLNSEGLRIRTKRRKAGRDSAQLASRLARPRIRARRIISVGDYNAFEIQLRIRRFDWHDQRHG